MCAFVRMAARLSSGRLDADLRLPLSRPRRLRLRVTAPPKVGFVSLGCPKALVDSERILTQLRAEGYDVVASYEDADLVVVNTCGFIDER